MQFSAIQELDVVDAGYVKHDLGSNSQVKLYKLSLKFPDACKLNERNKTANILRCEFGYDVLVEDGVA